MNVYEFDTDKLMPRYTIVFSKQLNGKEYSVERDRLLNLVRRIGYENVRYVIEHFAINKPSDPKLNPISKMKAYYFGYFRQHRHS